MNAMTPTSNDSTTSYKQRLLAARSLRGKGGLKAYDRGRLLVDVFEDREFRADCGNIDDLRAADILDEYVDDLCLSFLELRAMLLHFPRRSQWKEGRLARMREEMLRASQSDAAQAKRAPKKMKDEVRKVLDELRVQKARDAQVANDTIVRLRERIDELEAENATLRQQIRDLTRNMNYAGL